MTSKQEQLVMNNMKMVYEITKPYRTLKNYDDIVSEGVVGLCNAAAKFEELRGNNFSTFAYMHILGRCLNFINRDKVVIPKRTNGKYEKVTAVSFSSELENTCIHAIEYVDSSADETWLMSLLSHQLSEKHFKIVYLLYSGYKRKDVERMVNMNSQQLSSEINKIRNKLNELDIRSNDGRSNQKEKK